MADLAQMGAARHQAENFVAGAIGGAIVHIDDLEGAQRRQGRLDLRHHGGDIARLVARGNDDGDAGLRGLHGGRAHGLEGETSAGQTLPAPRRRRLVGVQRKAMPRRAKARRRMMAQAVPSPAPAMTSLG